MRRRVTGVSGGNVNLEANEVNFILKAGNDGEINCFAKSGALDQIIGALARMASTLRTHNHEKGSGTTTIAAEPVTSAHIQRAHLQNEIVVQLITDKNIPYTFSLTPEAAADIATRLKGQVERDIKSGTA